MEFKQLELVLAVCDAGSISAAARNLGISQPTLSKSIARLEEHLGVLLFERAGLSARPTIYGAYLSEQAQHVLASVGVITRELKQWGSGDSGKLRIGMGSATRIKPVPQLLEAMQKRYPALRLEVRQEKGPALIQGVVDGVFDVSFSYAPNADGYDELMRFKVFDDALIAAMRPDHELATAPCIGPRSILSSPVATFGITPQLREWFGDMTPQEQRHAEAFISDDFDLIRMRLEAGGIVFIGPRFLFGEEVASGRFAVRPLDWDHRFECWMLTTRGHWHSPIIRAVANLARERVSTA